MWQFSEGLSASIRSRSDGDSEKGMGTSGGASFLLFGVGLAGAGVNSKASIGTGALTLRKVPVVGENSIRGSES